MVAFASEQQSLRRALLDGPRLRQTHTASGSGESRSPARERTREAQPAGLRHGGDNGNRIRCAYRAPAAASLGVSASPA
jgi:hypothetical protein